MVNEHQRLIAKFTDELLSVIEKHKGSDISFAEAIGVLEVIKLALYSDMRQSPSEIMNEAFTFNEEAAKQN